MVVVGLYRVRGECEERKKEAEVVSAEVLSLNSQLSQSQASVRVTNSLTSSATAWSDIPSVVCMCSN